MSEGIAKQCLEQVEYHHGVSKSCFSAEAKVFNMASYYVQVLRGASDIASVATEIAELRERTGLFDNPLLCLDFFLSRVSLFPGNQPVVLLVRSSERTEGAVYLYEKTFCTIPTGYLRGFDHLSGESSVIAEKNSRLLILECAIRGLFSQRNVVAAWATVRVDSARLSGGQLEDVDSVRVDFSSMPRKYRLKLGDTFAATLGSIGPRTRRNLRYYRKRAEQEIKTTFEPQLTIAQSDQALHELSKRSFRPFAKSMSEWRRMDSLLRRRPGYFAVGLRSNGEWISYLAGIRMGKLTYVILQINHNGFARYSLSTVLRSYVLEHESGLGQKELNFVNGVCALFQHCCEPDVCVTFVARRGLAARVIFDWIAPRHSAPDHALNMRRWVSSANDPVPVRGATPTRNRVIPQEP
jgi:GNAT acetyltransferase-like protein